jgi:hypothetical protein
MIKKEIADKLFKAELSEQQKVEFATIYDDLNGSIREANMGFVQATDFVSKAQKEVRKSINDNEALLKELNKAEGLIKQIGLDSELKKVQKAQSTVSENLNALNKYYTNLLSL